MARKFLYFIAILIVLFLAGLVALRVWSNELTEVAFVPRAEFLEQEALATNAYDDPAMWISRPGLGANDPARWQPEPAGEPDQGWAEEAPEGEQDSGDDAQSDTEPAQAAAEDVPRFAVFFVHPTSYLTRQSWNAPLNDAQSQNRARIFVKGLASPFNTAAEIWAPRYRQATFGAFLTDRPEAAQAIDAAYQDIEQAFDFFVQSIDADMPIVLAGHSQGAVHSLRLLRDRIAGTPLAERIAMAYPIGWPISVERDLPSLGLPACETADQAGCIVSWSSFGEPADPGIFMDRYSTSFGLDGEARGDSPILCTNPLTGNLGGEAPAEANLGTLIPNDDLTSGELVAGAVPARCDERGLLLLGDPPELGPYVLPGNNYHVYDIPLFWENLRQDVLRRVSAWQASR